MSTNVTAKPPASKNLEDQTQVCTKSVDKTQVEPRMILNPGAVVPSLKHRYEIIQQLGSRGFGDVYKVKKAGTSEIFAMKTEEVEAARKFGCLKIESEVLSHCSRMRSQHFMRLFDSGRMADCKFIVMTLLGPTLDRIRNRLIHGNQFSAKTAQRICVQMLEAIGQLHGLGFLHRDLKPQNFSIGANRDDCIIHLLNFGLARNIFDGRCKLIRPRKTVPFVGTMRFAPRVAHQLQEQARKDDLESLCYVMVDCFNDRFLPWRGQSNNRLILQLKEDFVKAKGPVVAEIMGNLPNAFSIIFKDIDTMRYVSTPYYENYAEEMSKGVEDCAEPYDWVSTASKAK